MTLKAFLSAFILLTLTLSGCFKAPPPPERTRSAADKKLAALCQEELKLNVVITPLENTVWIYVPLKENLFDYKAGKKAEEKKPELTSGRVIKFLDGEFSNRTFNFTYAIAEETKYPAPDPGFASSFTETFTATQRNILTAVYRAYGDLDKVPGDVTFDNQERQIQHEHLVKAYIKTAKAPDFFVMVITDTVRGIASKTIFYFPDLVRGMTDASFTEEYAQRLMAEDLSGDPAAVDDAAGSHLEIAEISWPKFLTQQITRRVRFRYQRSDFPPQDDNADEILAIVQRTVSAYAFEDFDGVKLTDLLAGKNYDFRRDQLETFSK